MLDKKNDRLITLTDATVKYRNQILFSGLNLVLRQGEQWAVTGPAGSGKSALLQALAGQYRLAAGKIEYPFYERRRRTHPVTDPLFSPQHLMARVEARHDFTSRAKTAAFFYQQRFNAGYADQAPTVDDYLAEQAAGLETDAGWPLAGIYEIFDLEPLRHKHLIQLSTGENRRLRLGAALLKNPRLLLLDDPLGGLDTATRESLEDIFGRIAAAGITLVLTTGPEQIPGVITHVAALGEDRRLRTFSRADFSPPRQDNHTLVDLATARLRRLMTRRNQKRFSVLVAMKNARVAYGETIIFENINWTVRPGECWALTGPNGSGKSTLLSLINGDHPQAYANDITLFDRPRGSGESIWEIKRRIGFMSPELDQYFPRRYTCLQTVESGFYDTIGLFTRSRPENRALAEQWLAILGLASCRDIPLQELSTSRQRLCLLARALVKKPALLMLDEPCLGFDRRQQHQFREIIDQIAAMGELGIIYVTHHQETLPTGITHALKLHGMTK